MQERSQDRQLTAEDLYTLPDDGLHYELVAGCLVSEPNPGARHGRVIARLVTLLHSFAQTRGMGVVYAGDAGFLLARSPDTVRGPDVSFVSQERFRDVGDVATHFPGPPDLAVEVLSPHDRPADIHAKVADFLTAGTRIVWVVDPAQQRVVAYRSLFAPRVLKRTDLLEGEDVLPGFACNVAQLFEI